MTTTKHIILLFAVFLAACSSSKEVKKSEETSDFTAVLHRYEATFDPSEYGPDANSVFIEDQELKKDEQLEPKTEITVEPPEAVPGFRVQLLATASIDEANARKAEAEAVFSEERFYVVYDPPVYKLRAGNFLTRFEADRFAREVAERGYVDAWTVPDRVFKNLPPRSSPQPSEKQHK